jgi:hypothetical protein
VGGGVVGAGAAGFSVVDGAGAGAGAGAAFFSGAVAGGFVGAGFAAGFLAQPLNVNATKARTANAVRTTFLMVNPFRKTISLNTPPEFQRAKTFSSPVTYHRRFRKATCTRHSLTAKPGKNQDKNP